MCWGCQLDIIQIKARLTKDQVNSKDKVALLVMHKLTKTLRRADVVEVQGGKPLLRLVKVAQVSSDKDLIWRAARGCSSNIILLE